MKKLLIVVFVLMIITVTAIFTADRIVRLEQQVSPFYLQVDKTQLYISDGPSLSIYDLKTFKLKKKFGKQGEGPGEFIVSPTQNLNSFMFDLLEGKIVVQSIGKISYFTKQGEFMKEIRVSNFGMKPLSDGFVGYGITREQGESPQLTINIYDGQMNMKKKLHQEPSFYFNKPVISPFDFRSSMFKIYRNRIIIERGKNRIDILDNSGKLISSIIPEDSPVRISAKARSRYIDTLKAVPQLKPFISTILQRLSFPKHYPQISMFDVADDKIYIIGYQDKITGRKVLVYNLKGEHVGNHYIRDYTQYMFLPRPYTFGGNHFYQVHEKSG